MNESVYIELKRRPHIRKPRELLKGGVYFCTHCVNGVTRVSTPLLLVIWHMYIFTQATFPGRKPEKGLSGDLVTACEHVF